MTGRHEIERGERCTLMKHNFKGKEVKERGTNVQNFDIDNNQMRREDVELNCKILITRRKKINTINFLNV